MDKYVIPRHENRSIKSCGYLRSILMGWITAIITMKPPHTMHSGSGRRLGSLQQEKIGLV